LEHGQTLDKESKRTVETDDPSEEDSSEDSSAEVDAGVSMREGLRKDHSPKVSLSEELEGVGWIRPSRGDAVLGVRTLKPEVLAENVAVALLSLIVETGGVIMTPSEEVLRVLADGLRMTLPSLKVLAMSLVEGVAIVSPSVLV
jgi:hypothetical protein